MIYDILMNIQVWQRTLLDVPPPPTSLQPLVTCLHGPTLQGVGECSSVCCAICAETESMKRIYIEFYAGREKI